MSENQYILPPAGTAANYVVLHHTGIDAPHFDLMLQFPNTEKLATWRITAPPTQWPPAKDPQRIADHRNLYMSYQGPLTQNRGTVTRIEQGTATILANDHKTLHLRLHRPTPIELSLPAIPITN